MHAVSLCPSVGDSIVSVSAVLKSTCAWGYSIIYNMPRMCRDVTDLEVKRGKMRIELKKLCKNSTSQWN